MAHKIQCATYAFKTIWGDVPLTQLKRLRRAYKRSYAPNIKGFNLLNAKLTGVNLTRFECSPYHAM